MNNVKKELRSGIFYTAISKYGNVIISLGITAALARLLSPHEFGLVAIVGVFVSFFNLISDFGIGPAIIQNQKLSKKNLNDIFTFSVYGSLGLTFAFFISAPFISKFYNEISLIKIVRLLSISVLFYSLQMVPKALLRKELEFKKIGIISIISNLFSGSIGILLALKGNGVYALIVQSILAAFITFILSYYYHPSRFLIMFEMESIKKVAMFSINQFSFNLINYFSRNSDNLLIGKFLSSADLGYYDKAYKLMLLPVQKLTHVITPALFPVLARYQDDKEMIFRSYLKLLSILSIIGLPLSIFFYSSAKEIITIMFGDQWLLSIPVFKLLSLTIGLQMMLSSVGAIYQAINRTDLLLVTGIGSSILFLTGIFLGVFLGKSLVAIGWGLIFAFMGSFTINFVVLIKIGLKKSIFPFIKIQLKPLGLTVVLYIVYFLANSFLVKCESIVSISLKLLVFATGLVLVIFLSGEYKIVFKSILNKS